MDNSVKQIYDDYMSIKEVLKTFNISRFALHSWRKNGHIKAYKVAQKTVFKRSDVSDLLKGKEID